MRNCVRGFVRMYADRSPPEEGMEGRGGDRMEGGGEQAEEDEERRIMSALSATIVEWGWRESVGGGGVVPETQTLEDRD